MGAEVRGGAGAAADVDTVTSPSSGAGADIGVALYVTGPGRGTCHLLRPGDLVRIGRGADSTIVVDDPRVSRAHAVLHVTDPPSISDVGSANGTFVGNRRLGAG